MEQKRKLKGIADLYAVDDARKAREMGVTPVSPVTSVSPVTPVPLVVMPISDSIVGKTEHIKINDIEAKNIVSSENNETGVTGGTGVTGEKSKIALAREVTPVPPLEKTKSITTSTAAPQRDFTRVANSIVREAIPAGAFTGKGKQLYDYLYSQTRGAIVPTISARIPSDRVMAGAGMSRKTLRFHLERLKHEGLIDVEEVTGAHGGNIYTIYLPEEIKSKRGNPGIPGNKGDKGENIQGVQGLKSNPGIQGLNTDLSMSYNDPKTPFKTDDEKNDETHTLIVFARAFKQAAEQVCGSELNISEKEKERWKELAKVLTDELIAAGKRAGTVSSAPAFFAAHLRRTFAKKEFGSGGSNAKQRDIIQQEHRRPLEEAQSWTSEEGIAEKQLEKRVKERKDRSEFTFEQRRWYAQNQRPQLGNGWMVESDSGRYDKLISEWLTAQEQVEKSRGSDLREKKEIHRLTPESIKERGLLIWELIEGGYTIEQAERQFRADLHLDDWAGILATVTAQCESSSGDSISSRGDDESASTKR